MENEIFIKKVSEIDKSTCKPVRAGIIPYTFHNNQLYIGMGIDSKYHEFTDFSGMINYHEENCIQGAIREFKEETLSVFRDIKEDDIKNFYCIYDNKIMVIFVGFNVKKDLVSEKFKKVYKTAKKPENCGIIWFIPEIFHNLILNDNKMFKKIRDLLYRSKIYDHEVFKNLF